MSPPAFKKSDYIVKRKKTNLKKNFDTNYILVVIVFTFIMLVPFPFILGYSFTGLYLDWRPLLVNRQKIKLSAFCSGFVDEGLFV